jgi:hypothetical protein
MDQAECVGVCGRYGAGKSTIASFLTCSKDYTQHYTDIYVNNRMNYITCLIFGFDHTDLTAIQRNKVKDDVWNYTFLDARKVIENCISQFIDPELTKSLFYLGKYKVKSFNVGLEKTASNWVELSLANVLKIVASIIFDIDLDILLGITEDNRKKREIVMTNKYVVCGALTGRECLEYFGTDVLRDNFDKDVWIKILQREILRCMTKSLNVVIPDIRYKNERQMIDRLRGKLIIVYKNEKDLDLTKEDRRAHPAGWSFLEFISRNSGSEQMKENEIYILNNETIDILHENVKKSLNL